MLVDTRLPAPDPDDDRAGPGPGAEALLAVLSWLVPWPVLVVLMAVASLMADGWLGVGLSWGALAIAFWRLSRAYPTVGGLRDYFQ